MFLVAPYFCCRGRSQNCIVPAVIGRKLSQSGWAFFKAAQTTLSLLRLEGNCHSLAGLSSRQHRPHCPCCDWKETVTVWLGFLQGSTDHIVPAVIGRKLSQSGWAFFKAAQTTLSLLWLEGNCHSQQVWLGFLQGSTDHIVTAVIGRKLSQSTSLAGLSSRQHRPHCHCCDWKETATVN